MSNEITAKSLTYAEIDFDAYRITRFEAASAGVAPANWASQWDNSTTLLGVAESAFPSGKGVELLSSDDNLKFWKWGLAPAMADCSAVALLRGTSSDFRAGILLRVAGMSGYACTIEPTDNELTLWKIVSGTPSALETYDLEESGILVEDDANYWMRFDTVDIDGGDVTLRCKVWQGVLSDEPDLFTLFVDDTSSALTDAGACGLYGHNDEYEYRCGHFRVRSLFGDTLETQRFASATAYLPGSVQATPNLTAAAVNPSETSLAGGLGKRAVLNLSFKDHPNSDLGELYGSGSMWGRFRARQLFRKGLPVRLVRGLLGQTLGEMETRNYVLESFDGPTRSGTFSFVAQDALKLADNDRAQAPAFSNGFLQAGINSSTTAATLGPAGIGNAEYPGSGYLNIGGNEIVAFSRSGDNLTITRGEANTTAVAHLAEDRCQLCLLYVGNTPADIIHHLFTAFAGIDSARIPLAAWQTEVDTYLDRLYTRLIAEPTGINALVSELIEQAGLVLWTDEIANLIRLQVLRGIPSTAYEYNESNTMAGSIQTRDQRDKQLTQVWTYYGVRNPLESLDEANNFRSTALTIDTEGETLNGQAIIKKIYATWIPAFGRSTALRVNDLHLGRFAKPPRAITFDVMRYSGVEEPAQGGGYRIAWNGNQDEAGDAAATPIQITRVNPLADRFQVTAEEMLFKQFDQADLVDRVITIDSDIANVGLRVLHDAIYPVVTDDDVANGVNLTVVIGANVKVSSVWWAAPAFNVGTWPTGFSITLEVLGGVRGAGGPGGWRTLNPSGLPGGAGEGFPGGTALFTRFPINIVDATGEMWGGGGGGGCAADNAPGAGGGGGGGLIPGPAGDQSVGSPLAQPGTEFGAGSGGQRSLGSVFLAGGDGGQPGNDGNAGRSVFSGVSTFSNNGGARGCAIDGLSFVTTIGSPGDRRGQQVN